MTKKHSYKISLLLLIGISLIFSQPLSIYATDNIDFSQGELSEQDYYSQIIDQLFSLDTIKMTHKFEGAENISYVDINQQVLLTENKLDNAKVELYQFSDGSTAESAAIAIDRAKQFYVDKVPPELDDLKNELGNKYIVKANPENKDFLSQMPKQYNTIVKSLTKFEKKGNKIIGSSEVIPMRNSELFVSQVNSYGDKATVQHVVTIDPDSQKIIFEHILKSNQDPDEETIESTIPLEDEHHIIIEFTQSDKELPSLEELETISYEDLQVLAQSKNLDIFQ